VTLSKEEIEKRKKEWKPRQTNHNSGSIWKYAQTVGPAYEGAVTQPGAKKETHTYADI
jgi:dihydroxy-acid dehydratase